MTKVWVVNKALLMQELLAPLDYADSHAKVMSAIADLHIVSYDIVFAKDGHVLLRYSAEGSHCGQPHNGIEPSGRKAQWTASAIFEVKDGKVHSFTKEWDKLNMWKQLGWVCTLSEPEFLPLKYSRMAQHLPRLSSLGTWPQSRSADNNILTDEGGRVCVKNDEKLGARRS